jgi:hypothetical protein
MTVKRIISEIILNITFLFMYVSSCVVHRIFLSTSEILSITSKNIFLLIIDTQTTATMLLAYEEVINKIEAIKKVCVTITSLQAANISTGNPTVNTTSHITVNV